MNFLGVIPARYNSMRLEGKPLMNIDGKPMIQHVYERTKKSMETVYVATDDARIKSVVEYFGGQVVMTSKMHQNGTSRCLEATDIISSQTEKTYDYIINIQGDEPLVDPNQLKELMACFDDSYKEGLATLVMKVKTNEELFNESECFVVINENNQAMYFSRSIIPYVKGFEKEKWLKKHTFYKHVGFYAYDYKSLKEMSQMPVSSLESVESLEQNRWLEAGRSIKVGYTDYETIPVDTPDDLERVRNYFKNQK